MPADFDPIEFLRSRGIEPAGVPKATPAPGRGEAQAAPSAPASEDDGDEKSFPRKVVEGLPGVRFMKGMARGTARLGTDIGSLASTVAPSLANLPNKLPDVAQRALASAKEFGEQPSEGLIEGAGSIAGEYGPLMALPGPGLEAAAARAAARYLPPMFIRGGGFVPAAVPKGVRVATRAGDQAAKGATAGAIMDPDDPASGAMTGAVAGPALGAVGAGMRTPVGKWIGGHIPASLASHGVWAAGKALGIPGPLVYPAVHSIRWYSAPIGRQIIQRGRWITDQSGRILGEVVGPGTAAPVGAAASQAVQ